MWRASWKCYCSNRSGVCVPVGRTVHCVSHEMSSLSLVCACLWLVCEVLCKTCDGVSQCAWYGFVCIWKEKRIETPFFHATSSAFERLMQGLNKDVFCGAVFRQTNHDSICSLQRHMFPSDVHFILPFIQNKATVNTSTSLPLGPMDVHFSGFWLPLCFLSIAQWF